MPRPVLMQHHSGHRPAWPGAPMRASPFEMRHQTFQLQEDPGLVHLTGDLNPYEMRRATSVRLSWSSGNQGDSVQRCPSHFWAGGASQSRF